MMTIIIPSRCTTVIKINRLINENRSAMSRSHHKDLTGIRDRCVHITRKPIHLHTPGGGDSLY